MLPFEVAFLLKSGTECKSYDEFCRWDGEIIEQILALAEPDPEITSPFSLSERAYCPLCKDGGSALYEKGFALPIGLKRHLEGYGSMRRCVVFNAARRMALEHIKRMAEDPDYRAFEELLDRHGKKMDGGG
jgi:hypothetical protein